MESFLVNGYKFYKYVKLIKKGYSWLNKEIELELTVKNKELFLTVMGNTVVLPITTDCKDLTKKAAFTSYRTNNLLKELAVPAKNHNFIIVVQIDDTGIWSFMFEHEGKKKSYVCNATDRVCKNINYNRLLDSFTLPNNILDAIETASKYVNYTHFRDELRNVKVVSNSNSYTVSSSDGIYLYHYKIHHSQEYHGKIIDIGIPYQIAIILQLWKKKVKPVIVANIYDNALVILQNTTTAEQLQWTENNDYKYADYEAISRNVDLDQPIIKVNRSELDRLIDTYSKLEPRQLSTTMYIKDQSLYITIEGKPYLLSKDAGMSNMRFSNISYKSLKRLLQGFRGNVYNLRISVPFLSVHDENNMAMMMCN